MLHPVAVLFNGDIDAVRGHCVDIMRHMAPGGGFIVGPGCALPPETPVANIHAVMECARTAGRYATDGSLPDLR